MKVLLLFALGACSFPRASDALACDVDNPCDNGRVCTNGFCVVGEDTDGPSPDTARFDCTLWSAPEHFAPCDIPQPTGALDLTLGAYTYNTGTGELSEPGGATSMPTNQVVGGSMLISVDKLTIATGSSLRVIGTAPLIVAAWTDIEVIGDIDAGSKVLEPGAGANPTTECGLHAPTDGQPDGTGGGGAGGASFQGPGGSGGDGDGGTNPGAGGALVAIAPLLLGGCPGATGGTGALPGGPGGAGGGAFQLTAQGAITIGGKLNAGGAGGEPGQTTNDAGGGGGGGSGGMIGLEGASIAINTGAILAANGGGGGEGGDDSAGGRGLDGTATATRATGGAQNGCGNGGLGSGGATLNGGNGVSEGVQNGGGGGGGGGGGAGFIKFRSPAPATKGTIVVISPAETLVP